MTATIELKYDDIFESCADILINPVNTKGTMGAGLAAQFKKKFRHNYDMYVEACKSGDLRIGTYLVDGYYGDDLTIKYIFNFPTKDHWRDPSQIGYIEIGMQLLVDFINRHDDVHTIALPALGSGLGGLDWNKVYETIKFYIGGIDRDIIIYIYPPQEK